MSPNPRRLATPSGWLAAVIAVTTVTLLAACASGGGGTEGGAFPSDTSARSALDVPDAFVLAPGASLDELRCRSPLLDPRDSSRLVLVRSQGGTRGDYEVESDRYGVGRDELLRVDCRTLEAIGVVDR